MGRGFVLIMATFYGNIQKNKASNTIAFFEFNDQTLLNTITETVDGTEVSTITYPSTPTLYHGNYWAKGGAGFVRWDHTLFLNPSTTIEWVWELDPPSIPVKQIGISMYINGVRTLEQGILSNNAVLLNVNGATYVNLGGVVSGGNRYYSLLTWDGTETIYKIYSINGSNELSEIVNTTSIVSPDVSLLNLDSEVFSFSSFNGLDNFAGVIQAVKISNAKITSPTIVGI